MTLRLIVLASALARLPASRHPRPDLPHTTASGNAAEGDPEACGPTASLASCSDCTASLANSRVDIVLQEEGDALLSIRSVSDDCRAKAVGGDAWVIRFESNTSVWRQVATDMHNGTYVAVAPREELRVHVVTAWVQLW